MTRAALLLCFCLPSAAQAPARAAEAAKASSDQKLTGFAGHYGYLLGVPSDINPMPDFDGPVEVVQFVPAACKGATKEACVRRGMFVLLVMPKNMLFKSSQVSSVQEYAAGVVRSAKQSGEAPGKLAAVTVGKLQGWRFRKGFPKKGPFDTTTYIDGRLVSYSFAYQHDNKRMDSIMESLIEVRPTDVPPKTEAGQ